MLSAEERNSFPPLGEGLREGVSANGNVTPPLGEEPKEGVDYVCPFIVSAGVGLAELQEQFRADGDEYHAIMAKLLADRLTEAMAEASVGECMLSDTCENVHVINELDVPVLCMGLKDVVVSASPEGILVSDKEQSSYIKPFVDQIDQQIMFAEKSWGSFRVLDIEDESMTIKVTLNPGHSMNYHSHERRDEVWTIISGSGRTIVDGMEQPVTAGDVITMQAGCRHTIIADTELKVIEVQLGKEISVHDKQKFELEQ